MDDFTGHIRDLINHLGLMKKAANDDDAAYLQSAILILTTVRDSYVEEHPAQETDVPSFIAPQIMTPAQIGNLKGITSIRDHARRRMQKKMVH